MIKPSMQKLADAIDKDLLDKILKGEIECP